MSLQVEFTEFLNELWADVEHPSESRAESLDHAYHLMSEMEGKPPLHLVAEMYDNITGDEESAVLSHTDSIMWLRIVNTTAWVCHNMEDGQRVLDLGSNTGHQLLWWGSKFPNSEFTGIEISEKSVGVAKRWLGKKPVDNVNLLTGNLIHQPPELVNEKFDVVTTCFTLETIPDLYKFNHCAMPPWILKSLTPNGKIIACLTVPDWYWLENIIDAWREQGFSLISLDLYPVEHSAYPHLIMDKQGVDMDLDIVDFMAERRSILFDYPWKIHNPPFDNPLYWGDIDDHELEGIMAHPLRLETWNSSAPEFSSLYPHSDPKKPVFVFTHPDWQIDEESIALMLDWVDIENAEGTEHDTWARVGFRDIEQMGDSAKELLKEITESITRKMLFSKPEIDERPMAYTREHILALTNHFTPDSSD